MNENQQHSGWQNKTAYHILQKWLQKILVIKDKLAFFFMIPLKYKKVYLLIKFIMVKDNILIVFAI